MALQRISLLPLLSRCPLLSRKHLASGILCTRWHHNIPTGRTALMDEQKKYSDHKFLQSRNFFSYSKKNQSPEKIREDDNIEPHYELVYRALSVSYVQLGLGGVQAAVGSVCLTLGAMACGFPLLNASVLTQDPLEVGAFIGINFMICLGILKFCTIYPLRIYYSEVEDNFLAVFVGAHPLAIRHLKILPGEVKPRPQGKIVTSTLPWSNQLYSTPTQTIYLNEYLFKYPSHYNKLLGYVRES